jgi:RNA polymerase sigma factor (sigma-70 family)
MEVLEKVAQTEGSRLARHAYFTLRSLNSSLAQPDIVKDVIGNVFLTACEIIRSRPSKLPTVVEEMVTWLRRITLYKCLEYKKHVRRKEISGSESLLDEHSVVDIIDLGEYELTLPQAFKTLNEEERQVLGMYFKSRLTSKMIGTELKKDASTVRKTKQRALKKLRLYLEKASA